MARVDWRGAELFGQIAAAAIRGMARAEDDGVDAARGQSRVRTGRYRDGWEAQPPRVDGDTVRGQIVNEVEYSRWVSAGTSRMEGDFAHAAALDTAGARLPGYIREEVGRL